MHHSTKQDSDSEHTIYFQMSNGAGRFACAVRVASSTKEQANVVFRDNCSTIQQMARDAIARGSDDKPQLRLTFYP
jgi:hypothetical protein